MVVQSLFYLFSILAIFSALMVVSASNPVRGVLFLVMTFFAMSGVWMILQAEFLALILVLVYVGAVMTLFLFVVMMLNIDLAQMKKNFVKYLPWVVLLVAMLVGLTVIAVGPAQWRTMTVPAAKAADYSNLTDLGNVLYTNYAYAFEIAGAILLAAIIAAICLTHRAGLKRKSQNISEQVSVRREDRVRLVKNMK